MLFYFQINTPFFLRGNLQECVHSIGYGESLFEAVSLEALPDGLGSPDYHKAGLTIIFFTITHI